MSITHCHEHNTAYLVAILLDVRLLAPQAIDFKGRRLVAIERGRVNVESRNLAAACRSKTNDNPILVRFVSARLPSVIQCALGTELAFQRNGRTRLN